jgi:DNA-binding protein H-NS
MGSGCSGWEPIRAAEVGTTPMNLKSLSIEKLTKLKDQLDATIAAKVTERCRALESELANIHRIAGGAMRGRRGGLRGKVEPKYRNPNNLSETWAGRGLKPRWLTAAIKAGKNLEHFAIGATAKTGAVKKSRGRPGKK